MINNSNFSKYVLNWFHNHQKKKFPWQKDITIYKVWISEIMLQQTQVKTVIPYFQKFIKNFPTIQKLALSELNEILFIWSGLGYYKRAKNIHITSKIIIDKYQGIFPKKFKILKSFPGIGKSTAGAILSLALNQHFPILDGNIKRILNRYCLIVNPTEKQLWTTIKKITPTEKTAKFNQAMMDIGRTICTNKKPKCIICPLNTDCCSYLKNKIDSYPPTKKNKLKPKEKILWFLLLKNRNKKIWLEKRSDKEIWPELFCFPHFCKFEKLNLWLFHHNLLYNKFVYLPVIIHNLSHLTLKINPLLIYVDKNFSLQHTNGLWYNSKDPTKIGIPVPVQKILKKLNI